MDPNEMAPEIKNPVPEPDKITDPPEQCGGSDSAIQGPSSQSMLDLSKDVSAGEENGREKLKRHRVEVAGRVWIPDIWGQEELLKDWIDCSAFDASLVPSGIVSARAALAREGRRANSGGFRIENRC